MPRRAAQQSVALEDIPGVGIVRARSLRKAGITDIAALSRASAEQIAAIPGISPQKAQQLVDYARSNGATPAARTAITARRRRSTTPAPAAPTGAAPVVRRTRRAAPASSSKVIVPSAPVPAASAPSPPRHESELSALARRISRSATELLQSSEARALRRSLSRQLGKVVSFADSIIDYDMAEKAAAQAKAQLSKMEEAITRAAKSTKRAVQGRIAGELRTRRRKTVKRVSARRTSAKRA